MKVYENVFTAGEYGSDLWVRLFDTDTSAVEYKKFNSNQFVPPVFTLHQTNPLIKATHTTFDTKQPLYINTFKNTMEQKMFLKTINQEKAYGLMDRRFHYIRETFPNPEECNHDMRTCFLDIEVEVTENGFPSPDRANEVVTVIQMYDTVLKQFFVLGLRKWTGQYNSRWGDVKYFQFADEVSLLNGFIQIIQKTNPAILTGFNSNSFDLPYLVNRMKKLQLDFEKLSPIREITWRDAQTHDVFKYRGVEIKGVLLEDYRDLVIKYGYLNTPSFSLENVAIAYGLEGKSKQKAYGYQSFNGNYSGEGYTQIIKDEADVPPEELTVWKLQQKYPNGYKAGTDEELDQAVFDTFMKYAIRDVEVMLEIDEKSKLLNLAKTIAYLSGVTMDDVKGTLKFWLASMYNDAYKDNVILPLKQQYTEDCTYLAGWVRSIPGKYKWVTSFDIASAHPYEHVNHNIGADSIITYNDLHPELKELRAKFFSFYDPINYQQTIYGKKEPNDIQEETDYIINLLNNAEEIKAVLKKHNVIATVNGCFFDKSKPCYAAKAMQSGLDLRLKYKNEGKKLRASIEQLKIDKADAAEIQKVIKAAEYAESLSLAFKIRINSYYGANVLSMNPYSNGRLTGAAVAMSTRAVNKIQAIAVDRIIKQHLGITPDDKMGHVIVCDTDSIYATLDDLVKKVNPEDPVEFCKKFSSEVLLPGIYKLEKEFLDGLNVVDASMMKFDNEIIAETLITIALKRYFAKVLVADGTTLAKPKQKVVGISLAGKATPIGVKNVLKPTLDMFIDKDGDFLRKYLVDELEKFKKLSPKMIAGAQGVSSMQYTPYFENVPVTDWARANKFKKFDTESQKFLTAPLNSKGAIVHNHLMNQFKLLGRYELIRESDKINVVYLKVPNPITFNHNAVAFKDENVLTDFGLTPYIDIEKQWNKEVIDKLNIIAEAINWKITNAPDALDEW